MAGRATYDDAFKANVYVVLTANDGNVKRTARETDVPENTVRRWKREWEESGPPNVEELEIAVGSFLKEADELRSLGLQALRGKLELLIQNPKDVNVAQVTTLVGILTDKIDRAAGLTQQVEHKLTLPSPDEIRASLGGLVAGVAELARQRQEEIVDAEFVEEEPLALTR